MIDANEILTGIAVGLATSWVVGVSSALIHAQIQRTKLLRDLNAAHSALRKHLAREHQSVKSDFSECVRPHSMANPKTIDNSEDV